MFYLKSVKARHIIEWTTIVLFVVSAVFFFVRGQVWYDLFQPEGEFLKTVIKYRLAIPAMVLILSSALLLPWHMAVVFFFCAVGDLLGCTDNFVGQMTSFTVVQIALITMLGHVVWPASEGYTKRTPVTKYVKPYIIACFAVLYLFVLAVIVPKAPDAVIMVGVAAYALALCMMALLSIAAAKVSGVTAFACGGLFFLVSDFILASQRFLLPDMNMRFAILFTYYMAILGLWRAVLSVWTGSRQS